MRTTTLALLVACLITPVFAQKHSAKQNANSTQKQAAQQTATAGTPAAEDTEEGEDKNPWKGLQYRLVGPFRGGRVVAVAGVVGQDNVYYFGATAGGVWKTTDGGLNWKPIFDKTKDASPSIGAIAVSESDPNVIYVGTGEACIRGNIVGGNGVYKSIDAGKTWKFVGLADTHAIGRLAVNPKNPDIAFVAALGHPFGDNEERGIFRTQDGGKTWQKVLYKDAKSGGIDVVFDPSNSNILFAALWQARRTPWSLDSGGPGSGLYRSIDGGTTWKELKGHGLPEGILGRIGVTVSGANPNRVWAVVEAEKGGIYRSDDGGDTWHITTDDHRFRQRAWYYSHIFADPKSEDTVYILNTAAYRSNDGGKTFTRLRAPHGDNHALWIDPTNPKRLMNGNDGGATISTDGGDTWTSQYNQPTAQFYHVTTDDRFPYYIYGAQQDNSTVAIASASAEGAIDRPDWYDVGGGESGYIAPDPTDPEIVYAGSYGGEITRYDHRTGEEQSINPWP
ncbi:MAG: glycoside hydrolase, partial [Candidatus Sulfotelmatobacter sp.]